MAALRLVLAFVVTGLGSPALALDPTRAMTQYVQNVWRIEQGLPHNSVRAIKQTRDGYLWLGTYAGLARFDGVRFHVFDSRNSVLQNNEIRALHEDSRGVLWVGTTAGGLYRLENGQLHADGTKIESRTINAILSTQEGALLVGTGNGLYRIRGGNTERFGAEQGLWSNTVLAVVQAPDGRVFVGTEAGVNVLEADRIAKWLPAPSRPITALLFDREGGLFVGGRRTLDRFDRSEKLTLSISIALEGVAALFEDSDGIIWVGLYGAGIGRLQQGVLQTFRQEDGFLDRRAWSITADREGGLWIGTRGGLAQFRDGAAVSYSTAEGFAGDIGRVVFEDRDGALYFGFGGGVSRFKDGQVVNLDLGPRLKGSVIRGILRDRGGRLWISTDDGLAEEVGPKRFRIYGKDEALPEPRFIFEDRALGMWIASARGLLLMKDGRITAPDVLRPLANSEIQAIFEDRAGWLWIGTLNHGAWRLKGEVLESVPLLGLTSIGVRSFFEEEDGTFFIGTIGSGLFVRRPGGDFKRITTKEGLVDDSVWSILDDGRGQIWMTSDRGVFRVAKKDLLDFADSRSQGFRPTAVVGTTHGLKSREANGGASPAGLITRDGRVLVPTGAGVAIIDPRKLVSNLPPPPVQIEEVVVDRQTVSSSGDARIPPRARDTEIHYTGLSFVNPGEMHFRYRLDGRDPDWIDAGTRRVAYYGSLSPGSHVFRVAASNDGITWSLEEATINLTVERRWDETPLFRVVALGVILSLLAGAYAWRIRALKDSERELAALVTARTQELAERSSELERANAALGQLAVTDDLTGIANHRQFRAFLDREWQRCARTREPISLLMCDIDDFKAYNDILGHPAGDECLRAVAQTLTSAMRRAPDLAARYGGEEFAVVLPSTDSEGAKAVAVALREALADRALPHPGSRVGPRVTMSIGVATIVPSADTSAEDLIAVADGALYSAKTAGRDRHVVA